ncbi:MAG: hypothetical protein ACTSYQ_02230 [Candidatus Odinarchaeia archaeon]
MIPLKQPEMEERIEKFITLIENNQELLTQRFNYVLTIVKILKKELEKIEKPLQINTQDKK